MRSDKHINMIVGLTKVHQRAALLSDVLKQKKQTFCSEVRAILEYCSLVCNPGYMCNINNTESVGLHHFTKTPERSSQFSYTNRQSTEYRLPRIAPLKSRLHYY